MPAWCSGDQHRESGSATSSGLESIRANIRPSGDREAIRHVSFVILSSRSSLSKEKGGRKEKEKRGRSLKTTKKRVVWVDRKTVAATPWDFWCPR